MRIPLVATSIALKSWKRAAVKVPHLQCCKPDYGVLLPSQILIHRGNHRRGRTVTATMGGDARAASPTYARLFVSNV